MLPKKKPEELSELETVSEVFETILKNVQNLTVSDVKEEDLAVKPSELLFTMKDNYDLTKIEEISDFASITIADKHLLGIVGANQVHFFCVDVPIHVKADKFQSGPAPPLSAQGPDQTPCSLFFIETVKIQLKQSEEEAKFVKSEFYFPPENKQPEIVENLRVCEFTLVIKDNKKIVNNSNGDVILACGGAKGIIHLITFDENFELKSLTGHVNEIIDLKFCPPTSLGANGNYLLSSSKDSSIRLWNIKTKEQLASYRPISNPHVDQVSLDWFPNAKCFVSIGTDSTVKIWNAFPENLRKLIESGQKGKKKGKEFTYTDPLYVYKNLHENEETLTNSIQTTGTYLITKDLKGNIFISIPIVKDGSMVIARVIQTKCALAWDQKMYLHKGKEILLAGEDEGKIRVINIPRLMLRTSKNAQLSQQFDCHIQLSSRKTVKKAILSDKDDLLIAITDDRKLWLQDLSIPKYGQIFT